MTGRRLVLLLAAGFALGAVAGYRWPRQQQEQGYPDCGRCA